MSVNVTQLLDHLPLMDLLVHAVLFMELNYKFVSIFF